VSTISFLKRQQTITLSNGNQGRTKRSQKQREDMKNQHAADVLELEDFFNMFWAEDKMLKEKFGRSV
jgi:hypothetical protein